MLDWYEGFISENPISSSSSWFSSKNWVCVTTAAEITGPAQM